MKLTGAVPFLAAISIFFLLQNTGPGFPLLNPSPEQLQISEIEPDRDTPETVLLEASSFIMGGGKEVPSKQRPAHRVVLPAYRIGRYETTFDQFDAFCGDTGFQPPPDSGHGRGKRPAGCVSWYDALLYCNWLSEKEGLSPCYTIREKTPEQKIPGTYDRLQWEVCWDRKADGYRLPTEAEWEYAARGGPESKGYTYAGSNNIDDVAWYYGNGGRYPIETGRKLPNELGIYDMSGNVFEWTWDSNSKNYAFCGDIVIAPAGPSWGHTRLIRGGSCFFDYRGAGITYRKNAFPACRLPYLGFRIARSVKTNDS